MATAKKTKKVVDAEGLAHVAATFNKHDDHDHRRAWQHDRVGVERQGRLQGLQEVDALRRHGRR
jgi:hypothetical protein